MGTTGLALVLIGVGWNLYGDHVDMNEFNRRVAQRQPLSPPYPGRTYNWFGLILILGGVGVWVVALAKWFGGVQ